MNIDELNKRVVPIGIEDENGHTQIQIDCTPMFAEHPEAIADLMVQPPMGDLYTAETSRNQNIVTWTVSEMDLQYPGNGEFQLRFTDGNSIALSPVARFRIARSIE